MSYCIEQDTSGGRWIIANADDQELVWAGGHWVARDMTGGAHPVSFADEAAAAEYAAQVFDRRRK